MTKVNIFLGFLGGMAPYAVNMANQLVGKVPKDEMNELSWKYFLGITIFALLGSVIVFLFKEADRWKSFVLGISAPAMISLAAHDAQEKQPAGNHGTPSTAAPSVIEVGSRWSLPFVSSAYAQEPAVPVNVPDRIVELQPKGMISDVTVRIVDNVGNVLRTVVVPRLKFARINVPSAATAVYFEKGDSRTGAYILPKQAGEVVYYEVTGGVGKRKFGFFSGITGQTSVEFDLNVSQPSIAPLPKGTTGWAYVGRRAKGYWVERCIKLPADGGITVGHNYSVVAPSTVLDKLGTDNQRVGRLNPGQEVRIDEYKADGPDGVSNTLTDNGMFYGRMVVQ